MGKSSKPKKVAWKDTRFDFSAEYEFSMFVRNRCVFFHCLAKNVRRMVNYAESFAHHSQICVIYVYGDVKNKSLFDSRSGNILLIIIPSITAEDMKIVADYEKWLKALKKQGLLKIISYGEKKKYTGRYVNVEYGREPSEDWYDTYNDPSDEVFYEIYLRGKELIEKEKAARERIRRLVYGELQCRATFPVPNAISGAPDKHGADLLGIIRGLYPYGVEVDTSDDYAVKRLAAKRIAAAVFDRSVTSDIKKLNIDLIGDEGQISFWDNVSVGASECVRFLQEYFRKHISEEGCFNIAEAWYRFTQPPYGAYECNWYDYLFAYALRDYDKPEYLHGTYLHSTRLDPARNITLKNGYSYKSGFIFYQNENQELFRLAIAKLFDISEPAASTQNVLTQARAWITDHIHYVPLDCVDHRLNEILAGKNEENLHLRSWDIKQQYWYHFGYEKEYLPWLLGCFDDLYERIHSVDRRFFKRLSERYGRRRAVQYFKHNYVKRGAIGWLHSREMLEERVEKYMKEKVCRECGNLLNAADNISFEASKIIDGELRTYEFTYKDVVGLNKKLLDMNCSEYYCIPCLCELTGYDGEGLHHLIHVYKQQGCTLF